MKSRLLFVLMFIGAIAHGQTVPDTEAFTLQQVYAAVSYHASPSQDLVSCFAEANPDFFDPTYNNDGYAPANSMLRFRNYDASGAYYVPTVTIIDSYDNSGCVYVEYTVSIPAGGSVLEHGVVWSTSVNPPTTSDNDEFNGSGIGTFSLCFFGYSPPTNVYYRAYAITAGGVYYSATGVLFISS